LQEQIKNAYEQVLVIKEEMIKELKTANETLKIKLDEHDKWLTVRRYNIFNGNAWNLDDCKRVGKRLSYFCRDKNYEVKKALDGLFGEVNSYHIEAFEDYLDAGAIL
jgi:hypothetical protein